jgi:hypothetical protein
MKQCLAIVALVLAALPTGFAQQKAAPSPAHSAAQLSTFLPEVFAGWQKSEDTLSSHAEAADPGSSAVLNEYGFRDVETAAYTREGRTLKLKAARFTDATGAYGAFTFYKTADMETEKIGDQGSYTNNRVLFYAGNILVDAKFDRLTAMSAAELRELAAALPKPAGASANLPVLPAYLPKQG